MNYCEVSLTPETEKTLLKMSADWSAENSCRGYYANDESDLKGNRFFLALDNDTPVGYLFGKLCRAQKTSTVMTEGTPFFEVEEIYIVPAMRSKGIGGELFRFAENLVWEEADFVLLSTATRNWRAILHFYIDELGMEFWSARLFKPLDKGLK